MRQAELRRTAARDAMRERVDAYSRASTMTTAGTTTGYGWRIYGLGIIALGAVCLAFGDFHPGQPVPKDFPARTTLAYAVAIFMLIAGAAIEWRRTRAIAAVLITAYWTLIVVLLMNGRVWLAHVAEFGPYESHAIQLAIAAGGLIVYADSANLGARRAESLVRIARLAFGLCLLVFGTAHFVYMNLTAPLVPKWLPPSQEFWGYVTGVAHIAAGIAILAGVQARLAAILLTIMFALFSVMVHIPMAITGATPWIWNENAVNLALIGAAWVVADSLAKPRGV
jgi:uncharacterized membrane protein YphA (DoxX/SURF4 family)